MKKVLQIIEFIAICEAVGAVGALFTTSAIPSWYSALAKPSFAPPNWLFGPVWSVLYALMGVALWIVGRSDSPGRKKALRVFALQLVLNAVWSPVFFGARSPLAGLIIIVCMWLAIVWTIASFAKISRTAAWLLAPYLAWVSFATLLNYSIWMLNK